MSKGIIDSISRMIGGNPSLNKVADDLQLTSELILLVRMMFADGELQPTELTAFRKLCTEVFNLDEEDIPGVLEYLKEFGYETTSWDAASMFVGHDIERKKALLVHLLNIAKADNHLDLGEIELIRRTTKILGLTAEDLTLPIKS